MLSVPTGRGVMVLDNPKLPSLVFRLYGPRDLRVDEEILDLGAIGEREIAARTLFTAVSTGTELAAYRGDPPLRPTRFPYPRLVGYCNVAEVIAVGEHATGYRPGDVILSGQSHRSAYVCDAGSVFLALPPQADPAAASLAYLMQLGYVALQSAGAQKGQRVAVIGLGVLGLATVACARMMGLDVSAVSNQEASLDIARQWGARAVAKHDAISLGAIDCVVLTSNLWQDWLLSLKTVNVSGTIATLGFPGRGQALPDFNPLDSQWLYDKRLTIKATGPPASPDQLRRNLVYLINQMAAGALHANQLISKTIRWQDLPTLYAELAANRGKLLTAVLKW
jgi:threonine dehydrogenase-like Zn-dependent dehydrogenase